MVKPKIISLDLAFQNVPGVIAAYLLPHAEGAALIECGPGSTQENLSKRLAENGFTLKDISDVFLTHIHLDHAGAAGWIAQHGAQIHVHPAGAPHLVDPSKLLSSASRIYGEEMDTLWGSFIPVAPEKLSILADNERVSIADINLIPVATPGHASHHMVYFYEGVCFSGDVGGVRLGGSPIVRVPMPPPEFHLETWRNTLDLIDSFRPEAFAPTHFGVYTDASWHLTTLRSYLDEIESWMETTFNGQYSTEGIRKEFDALIQRWDDRDQVNPSIKQAYELANPSLMSLDGMLRYWRKNRNVIEANN